MVVLTNNYTTEVFTRPLYANEFYKKDRESINNFSTIVTWPEQKELNSHIHKLLNELSLLENNWDYEDAIAPNKSVIQKAELISNVLEKHGQPIFHAAPGPNGEVMLDIRNNKRTKSLEVIFYPSRSVVITFPEEGKPTQENFDFNKLPELLKWLNEK